MDEKTQRVARRLADKRLLITARSGVGEQSPEKQTANVDKESDSVEVAHEELLRRWGRLKQWVNEDRQFLQWTSRVDLKVEEFQRDGSAALLSGKPLQESKKFYPARRADMEEKQRVFLGASLKADRQRKWLILGSACLAILLVVVIGFGWHRSNQQQRANGLVTTLVGTKAATVGPYLDQLEPYKEVAVPRLCAEFANADRSLSERAHAAYALVRFGVAGSDELTFLLDGVSALPNDECENLIRALETVDKRQPLNQKLKQRLDRATSASDRGRYAAVALRLGVTDGVNALCELKEDRSSRAALIHAFDQFPSKLTHVAQILDTTEDRNLRSAVCLAIGTLGVDAADATAPVLKRLFVAAADAGTHSAAGWALRQQGYDREELRKLAQSETKSTAMRDWVINSQHMTMIKIRAGTFEMGSKEDDKNADDDERPAHSVTLSTPFWLSDREVSVEQFRRFVEDRDYTGPKPNDWEGHSERYSPTDEHPVQTVSWHDAVQFCNWLTAEDNKMLSDEEKLTPYYDEEKWKPEPGANGYRLPAEAEWEYACRAGSTSDYCFGDAIYVLSEYGVYTVPTTAVCASKLPNGWGLFDMHGNVYEWCADWYGEYSSAPITNPTGLPDGQSRVLRGGSFDLSPRDLRSAGRYRLTPDSRDGFIGFRISRTAYQSGL